MKIAHRVSSFFPLAFVASSLALTPPAASVGTTESALQNTTYTTDTICTACGCSVSGFACNRGLRPSPKKLDCINNAGGPKKVAMMSANAASEWIHTPAAK